MARIRHIALVVKDLEKTADFYQKALGLSRSEMSEGPTARRIYGYNARRGQSGFVAIQERGGFRPQGPAGFRRRPSLRLPGRQPEGGAGRDRRRGGQFFFDLGEEGDEGFERKFKDPNGIIFDVNDTGWTMTSRTK